jgi:hypothetical protein
MIRYHGPEKKYESISNTFGIKFTIGIKKEIWRKIDVSPIRGLL